jgi:hypothetical protein
MFETNQVAAVLWWSKRFGLAADQRQSTDDGSPVFCWLVAKVVDSFGNQDFTHFTNSAIADTELGGRQSAGTLGAS